MLMSVLLPAPFSQTRAWMEVALVDLLARARKQRSDWLAILRGLLADLLAYAGDWEALRPCLEDDQLDALKRLHTELAPKPRPAAESPPSPSALRRKLRDIN